VPPKFAAEKSSARMPVSFVDTLDSPIVTLETIPDKIRNVKKPPKFCTNADPNRYRRNIP